MISSINVVVCSAESGSSPIVSAFVFPPRPTGAMFEQLGSRGRDDEERHVADPVDEPVDEVEQRVVGPVQILDDDDRRRLGGHRLEEQPPARERLRLTRSVGRGVDPHQRADLVADPTGVGAFELRGIDRVSSFAAATAPSSESRMPHSCFTISASAKNATPLPYESTCPRRQVVRSGSASR